MFVRPLTDRPVRREQSGGDVGVKAAPREEAAKAVKVLTVKGHTCNYFV